MMAGSDIGARWSSKLASFAASLLFIGAPFPSAAQSGTYLQNVLVSRDDDRGLIEFRFSCPTRYVFHAPLSASDQLRISLVQLDQCGPGLIGSPLRESRRPVGAEQLGLREVELIMQGGSNVELRVYFEEPMTFFVAQAGDLRSVRLRVDLPLEGGGDVPAFPGPVMSPDREVASESLPPVHTPEQIARADAAARAQLERQGQAQASPAPRYAINLESSRDPIDVASVDAGAMANGQSFYITSVTIGKDVWQRLRLGFFATEAEAEQALAPLAAAYPQAWIVRIGADEAEQAVVRPDVSGTPTAPASAPAMEVPTLAPSPAVVAAAERTLSDEQLAKLAADAKAALMAKDYGTAVQTYTKLLREPEHEYSRQAQEFLGLARERNGQTAHAVAEYRRFLDRYPDGEDARRVRQRLAGLATAGKEPKKSRRAQADTRPPSPWNFFGGVSQYYRRDVNQFDEQEQLVSQSAVLTDTDFVARRRGERFNFESRMTLGNAYDLLSEDEGTGNSTRIYYLYMDLEDRDRDVSGRLGRQTLHTGGVLGRFDGAYLSYQWRPDLAINFTTGFPVDTTDDGLETARFFYGVSVDFAQWLELFDVNLYFNTQDVDGLQDRQAVGTDIRYFDGSKSLITTLDYDISYNELNSVVALGNWRFDNRVTLNAMIDMRNSPYLTTHNALIGQPVATIDDLLLTFSEDEIRDLALDRTSEVQTYAIGISTPLFERFQINADVTLSDFEGTPASGGVPELPALGQQYYYSLNILGTSLLREGDMSIIGLRYTDGDTSSTSTLTLDTRYPVTDRFRVNPRLQLIVREDSQFDTDQFIARPSLRLFYRMGRKYRLELDVGGELADREIRNDSSDSSSYFIYAGYRADL